MAHTADEAGRDRAVDAGSAVPAGRGDPRLHPGQEFEGNLVDECEEDIRQAFAAGAARVSVDFTQGAAGHP